MQKSSISISKKLLLGSILIVCWKLSAGEDRTIVWGATSDTAGSTYEVAFCARARDMQGNPPGHAFVVLRQQRSSGDIVVFKTAGYSPTKSSPIHDGIIGAENYSHPSQRCLIVLTNKGRFERISSSVESDTNIEISGIQIPVITRYILGLNDCVTFMSGVAAEMGLVTPSRVLNPTPIGYVAALQAAN